MIRRVFNVRALVHDLPHSRDITRRIEAENEDDARRQFAARHTVITFHWIRPYPNKKKWQA